VLQCDTPLTHVLTLLYYAHAIMPNPTPTNFRIAQELQFQHADCTSKVQKKCPTVLYASSSSATHTGHI